MGREILYCKKFDFKDEFLQDLLGNHPKTGDLCMVETDEVGARRIVLSKDDKEYLLYISGEKGDDLRYSFEFVKFKPSLIFDEMRIPHASNPRLMEEWIKSKDKKKRPAELLEDNTMPIQNAGDTFVDESLFQMQVDDQSYLEGFTDDLKEFFPDIYEGFMNSIVYMNDILTDTRGLDGEASDEALARLLNSYIKNKRLESLALLQLAIISRFNKEE